MTLARSRPGLTRRPLLAAALTAAAAAGLAACADLRVADPPTTTALPASELPPPPPREFRGVWVATVTNIDWPSRPGLAAEAQRAEAVAILDRARTIGLNAVILQVRAEGDAFYESALEPWSEYLSGQQGRPPYAAGEPPYDPLAFWVEQAHRRGLELHAWFNPYRARHSAARSPPAPTHLALREPALVRRYGDMLWTDPGEPAAAQHMLAVVADVVRRYDVDGVHIDDYFYPYPAAGNDGAEQPFPDDASWARYRLEGGALPRDDWRRANVDALVQALQRTVRQAKPWVRFGISPFGIGKPASRPPGVSGFSQYDKLYADVEKWFRNGWLDYLVPQLYWPIDRPGQQFPVLLDYWRGENSAQRHLWPGLFTSQVRDAGRNAPPGPRAWPAQEIVDQVALQRSRALLDSSASGHVHFSMVALLNDRDGLATQLQRGAYADAALVPATPWLQAPAVAAPRLRLQAGQVLIDAPVDSPLARWAVWRRLGGGWRMAVLAASERSIAIDGADAVAVAAVDRVGNLGPQTSLRMP